MIIETMTSMKDTLDAAITRAVKNKKKTDLKMIGARGVVLMISD